MSDKPCGCGGGEVAPEGGQPQPLPQVVPYPPEMWAHALANKPKNPRDAMPPDMLDIFDRLIPLPDQAQGKGAQS